MAPGGMFPVAPDYVIPLPDFNNNQKRKGNHGRDIVPKKRYRDDYLIPDPAVQVGAGKYQCETCGKRYARKWTMERHRLTHQESDDGSGSGSEGDDEDEEEGGSEENEQESGIENNSDEEGSEDDGSEDEEEEPMSSNTIKCLLHMVGAAELGKLVIKTGALRVFVTDDKKNNEDDENELPVIGPTAIRFLKELLIAAQDDEIFLTKSLYSNILDAIDKAVEFAESESEEDEE
jgi:hypothetical protein